MPSLIAFNSSALKLGVLSQMVLTFSSSHFLYHPLFWKSFSSYWAPVYSTVLNFTLKPRGCQYTTGIIHDLLSQRSYKIPVLQHKDLPAERKGSERLAVSFLLLKSWEFVWMWARSAHSYGSGFVVWSKHLLQSNAGSQIHSKSTDLWNPSQVNCNYAI